MDHRAVLRNHSSLPTLPVKLIAVPGIIQGFLSDTPGPLNPELQLFLLADLKGSMPREMHGGKLTLRLEAQRVSIRPYLRRRRSGRTQTEPEKQREALEESLWLVRYHSVLTAMMLSSSGKKVSGESLSNNKAAACCSQRAPLRLCSDWPHVL